MSFTILAVTVSMMCSIMILWFFFGEDTDYYGRFNSLTYFRARIRWLTVRGEVFVFQAGEDSLVLERKKDYGEVIRCKVLSVNGREVWSRREYPDFVHIPKKEMEYLLMKEIEVLTKYD